MAAEVDEGGVACRFVPGSLEPEPVALASAHVPVRPELGPGAREREVHVEEDRPEHP